MLELAPDNVEALSGLAILEMNGQPDENLSVEDKDKYMAQQVESAIKLLERAYHSVDNLGDQNAVVLNHLANHFVITNDLEKALKLAMKAFNNTEVDKKSQKKKIIMCRSRRFMPRAATTLSFLSFFVILLLFKKQIVMFRSRRSVPRAATT